MTRQVASPSQPQSQPEIRNEEDSDEIQTMRDGAFEGTASASQNVDNVHLPAGAKEKRPDMEWVMGEDGPRRGIGVRDRVIDLSPDARAGPCYSNDQSACDLLPLSVPLPALAGSEATHSAGRRSEELCLLTLTSGGRAQSGGLRAQPAHTHACTYVRTHTHRESTQ